MLQSFSRAQGSGKRAKKDPPHRIYLPSTNLPKTTLLAIALVHSTPEKTFNCKALLILFWGFRSLWKMQPASCNSAANKNTHTHKNHSLNKAENLI